jgi:hypothetical protein
MSLDGVPFQIKTNCYSNIRKYIQDEELPVVDITTNHISSSKKRKILHHFLDEDDDHEGNAYILTWTNASILYFRRTNPTIL